MKVLVLGAGGMAGHTVALYLRDNDIEVDTLSAKTALDKNTHLVDVLDKPELSAVLKQTSYDAVINCIGILVKQSEEHKDLAVYINSYLPHYLESFYKNSKTKVIHISTDAVFSSENSPYTENADYNSKLFYGRSKALGEIINLKDLTFRTSIIGPDMNKEGTGLFNWFYSQKGDITGYTSALWNGVTTLELAKAILAALKQNLSGLYHLSPTESISKYDLLLLFKEVFTKQDVHIKSVPGSSTNTILVNTRKDFDFTIPEYRTMIHDMKAWIDQHPKLYRHYESR